MIGNTGTYVVFALGILVGMILGNKDFRYKFFKGMRGFLAQISTGARSYSERRKQPAKRLTQREEKPNVQHIYRQVHSPEVCPVCEGSGRVYAKVSKLQEGAPGFKPSVLTCPECEGEGKMWN